MAKPANKHRQEGVAGSWEWTLLLILVVIGGSSFAMIRGAVDTIPPAAVTVVRLWIGAAFLYIVMRVANRRLPTFIVSTSKGPRIHRAWIWMIAIAAVGYTAPFFIFPWAQQFIDSGLAGVYMAFMPIWTVVLAYFFANESLGPRKIIGFVLGFAGVLILMGPAVIGGAANSSVIAQAGVLIATMLYASYAVMTRRAPTMRPRVFAAGTLIAAAIMSTPALLFYELKTEQWSLASILSVIGLGLGPTGLAGIILIIIIRRVGAGFMALGNYLTPVFAVVTGALVFGERLAPQAFVALAVILAGVAISSGRGRKNVAPSVMPGVQPPIASSDEKAKG